MLQEVPGEDRDIDLLLTDRNLRILGLIERRQSILLDGALKSASKKRVMRKKRKVVVIEEADSGRTHTDEEPLGEPADVVQDDDGQRKGKTRVFKPSKKGRWKTVVTSRLVSGIRISEMPPPRSENLYEGLTNLSIPDNVSFSQGAGSDEFQHTIELSEPFPINAIDTSGWSGGCTYIHTSWHHTNFLLFAIGFEKLLTLFLFCFADIMSGRGSMLGSLRHARRSSTHHESHRRDRDRDQDRGYSGYSSQEKHDRDMEYMHRSRSCTPPRNPVPPLVQVSLPS